VKVKLLWADYNYYFVPHERRLYCVNVGKSGYIATGSAECSLAKKNQYKDLVRHRAKSLMAKVSTCQAEETNKLFGFDCGNADSILVKVDNAETELDLQRRFIGKSISDTLVNDILKRLEFRTPNYAWLDFALYYTEGQCCGFRIRYMYDKVPCTVKVRNTKKLGYVPKLKNVPVKRK
jgi:hypothetical protein